ncbi:RNA polymerase sigma factor, sigma-70 family [Micromonospora nigra]|uniref:RNA polymerase sigma factor, sigma-70 family n=1 Tax=Micromonospora nigra TaxID=145857 RepID=A0A1C6RF53_9ACTN|nr:sigma-70 family RNA polymerase sigma factor [Micromonospora nigra]SCL15806.1 RNA polymerase sigma factor, sigma-70 family [Micromonospora nigra]
MDTAAQDDSTLVEALRRGERAGLEGMYRRYVDRLYTYARTVLREPEAAADAVHDAFLAASQRIDQLREPDRLRSWLYAIVRNECLRQLRDRSRSLPLEEAGEPAADGADPGAGVNAEQVRDLVHTAVAALNPGDREVVHLAIRHDLSSADIGTALGVPTNHAHARLSRARSQLERALGALLVASTGARDCPTLAGLIDGWQGRLTPTLRKRVSRHIESCAVCGLLRREQLSPAALLSAYTAPAFLVAADTVWPRLVETWATGVGADPASFAEAAPAPGAAADPVGAVVADLSPAARPVRTTSAASHERHRRRMAATVALLILLAALGTWALAPGRPTAARDASGQPASQARGPAAGDSATHAAAPPPVAAPATGTRAAEPPAGAAGPTPGAVVAPSKGDGAARTDAPDAVPGRPVPSPTAAPSRPPTAPRPTAAPPVAAAFTVTATAHVRCGSDTYTLVVEATGSAALDGAEVRWTPNGGSTSVRAMTVDGAAARVSVGRLGAPRLTWSVRATATDGRTAQSPTHAVTDPCVRPG